jgi:hypothetical protein
LVTNIAFNKHKRLKRGRWIFSTIDRDGREGGKEAAQGKRIRVERMRALSYVFKLNVMVTFV